MIAKEPLFGVGLGRFKAHSVNFWHAHNAFLHLAAEAGQNADERDVPTDPHRLDGLRQCAGAADLEHVVGAAATCEPSEERKRQIAAEQEAEMLARAEQDTLEETTFRRDSALGVSGLVEVYRQGRVAIANAIGTGVADDKALQPHVGDLVRFFCGEEPLLDGIPTVPAADAADDPDAR